MPIINFKFLLASLIILLFAIPTISQHTDHTATLEIVFGAALIFGLLSLMAHAKEFLAGVIVALFSLTCAVIAIFTNLTVFSHLMLIAAVIFFVQGIVFSIYQVFLADGIDFNKIIGAVCIYILLALLWAIFYQFLEFLVPGSFHGITSGLKHVNFNDFLYLSLVTLSTLGYGDLIPVTPLARVLAIIEVITGVFYIAILVATLVGDFMSTKKQSSNEVE